MAVFYIIIDLALQPVPIQPKETSTPVAGNLAIVVADSTPTIVELTPIRPKHILPRRLIGDDMETLPNLYGSPNTPDLSNHHTYWSMKGTDVQGGDVSAITKKPIGPGLETSTASLDITTSSFKSGDHSYATTATSVRLEGSTTGVNAVMSFENGDHSYATTATSVRLEGSTTTMDTARSFKNGDHSYATTATSVRLEGSTTSMNTTRSSKKGDHSYATTETSIGLEGSTASLDSRRLYKNGDHSYATKTVTTVSRKGRKKQFSGCLTNADQGTKLTIDLKTIVRKSSSFGNTTNGSVSVLAKHNYTDMCDFSWDKVVKEMEHVLPELVTLLRAVMAPNQQKDTKALTPYLGTIYGIIMKARHPRLSLVQTVMSMCMMDSIANQKVRLYCHVCTQRTHDVK